MGSRKGAEKGLMVRISDLLWDLGRISDRIELAGWRATALAPMAMRWTI